MVDPSACIMPARVERYRRLPIASELMGRSEAEAKALGAANAYLETTDFQTLEFYTKREYEVFAQLPDQPPGYVCYYVRKSIPTNSAASSPSHTV